MEMNGDKPVTKKELTEALAATEDKLRGEMGQMREGLRGEMSQMKAELKGDIARVDGKVDRIAMEVANIKGDMARMDGRISGLATKEDVSLIMSHIDSFAGKVIDYERGSVARGDALDEHGKQLRDHEDRIKRLESGKKPG